MKILVTEHSDHFSLLNHLDGAFSIHHDPEFVFRLVDDQNYWKSIFKSKKKVRTFSQPSRVLREVGFFFYILKQGFRVDRIIINTGPEYESGKIVLLSLLAYLPHKKKLIYSVRNPSQFESGLKNRHIAKFLRGLLIKNAKSLIFENIAVESETIKLFPECGSKSRCILYTSFLEYSSGSNSIERTNLNFVIGILGTISPERRDYQVVLDALNSLEKSILNEIEVLFLGSQAHPSSESIVDSFRKIVRVKTVNEVWLSDRIFVELGNRCNIFLAPLKFGLKSYGIGGSTGAFGDAIRLKKVLIIPRFADPLAEFSDFCSFYEDVVSLSVALLRHFKSREALKITEQLEAKFGKKKISEDLNRLISS
jgi:hypothetical protein